MIVIKLVILSNNCSCLFTTDQRLLMLQQITASFFLFLTKLLSNSLRLGFVISDFN